MASSKRHRNLFREYLDAHARQRAESGLAPLTHEEWAEYFNGERPKIGGKRVPTVAESSISRAVSGTRGVARRIGIGRRWMLKLLGIDYDEYLSEWGRGPEQKDREDRRRGGRLPTGGAKSDRTDGGRPAME